MLSPSWNSMSAGTPALLVAHEKVLRPTGGGVQVCNREYMASLNEAGFALHSVPYEFSRSLFTRLANRLMPRVTKTREPGDLLQTVQDSVRNTSAKYIFFAANVFADVSRELKRQFPNVYQVLLSHGLESIDFCIEQQIRRRTRTENRSRTVVGKMLGRELLDEFDQRRDLDFVLTLSPLDAELEQWLGVDRVMWIPRTVMGSRLATQPIDQRVGCVSTLDHPPNSDGLLQLFAALQGRTDKGFRFRLVGSPKAIGRALAERHEFVDYLGPLSDEELRAEAATWCCFVHPLFVYAKGCSTKLATGLGWGLPIATTKYGTRGYIWDENAVPLARSPEELADYVLERCSTSKFAVHQKATQGVIEMTPSLASVGAQIRSFLQTVPTCDTKVHR